MVTMRIWIVGAAATVFAGAAPTAAQDFALKGGIAISHFEIEGTNRFTDDFISTSFGGHYRRRIGPIWLQPEVNFTTKGAQTPAEDIKERLRLEYLELPLLLAVPIRLGNFEPYAFGGPLLALEVRCRWIIEEEGLKTNFGCDAAQGTELFDRRVIDYGATAGAGVAHRIGSGKVMLEARQTWGLRNISDEDNDVTEIRNRTIMISIGYAAGTGTRER